MAIIINIDVMLAKRKMSVTELTEKVGITMANVSIRLEHMWNHAIGKDWTITPAKKPPPGVQSNFVDPVSIGSRIVTTSVVCLILTSLFFGFRLYVRSFISHNVSTDDC